MTPGARVAAAIDVLDAWQAGMPVEQALTNWARRARYAGSKDRAAVRDHVYDVLRARGTCSVLGGGESGRALMLGLVRFRGEAPAAVFSGERHAPAALGAEEAALAAAAPDATVDVPEWTVPLFRQRLGDDLSAGLDALRHRAPIWLRVNPQKAGTVAAAHARLAEEGIDTRADDRAPWALEVTGGARRVKLSSAYGDGWVELQDLSAQRAVAAVNWPEGRVLDYCAGGGGKALAIAATGTAAVLAHDAAPGRMRDLPVRAARAGVDIAICARGELSGRGPFDAVLCDVPCSGSGTWRRDPEAKWRLTPERLERLVALQQEILDEAARLVRPGGRLVYMTCSLFHAENETQVAAFLDRHAGWTCHARGCDTPLTASDGFFHAVIDAP